MARLTNVWFMSPSTEILTLGAFGFVHAATQCYWYFGEGKTDRILGSMDTKGHFTAWEDKIIKSTLHGMEFAKNALTPVQLLFYLLMFHALVFKRSPARMVPWLLVGAVKDIGLGAVITLSEAFICYVVNLPRPCAEVTIFLITELAVQLYLWGSTLLLYQELANREIAAEGEAYWASAASGASPAAEATPLPTTPSDWEAAPAGLRATTPKRRLDDSVPELTEQHVEGRARRANCPAGQLGGPLAGQTRLGLFQPYSALLCSTRFGATFHSAGSGQDGGQETRPTKKRAVHGEAAAGSHAQKPRANKAVQANTLSRRWLLEKATGAAGPKLKETTSPRTRRSAGRTSATPEGSGTVAQSRSQYAHRDVSPRAAAAAAAAWTDDANRNTAS